MLEDEKQTKPDQENKNKLQSFDGSENRQIDNQISKDFSLYILYFNCK